MKIKDILQRDPAKYPLVNHGQARIVDQMDARSLEELKGELSTFVCEGQYVEGIHKILRSYIDNVGRTSQKGAWVSGFFGSGKSHLLKMLCHLWQDTPLPGEVTARTLIPSMPDDIRAILRELDTAGKRSGGLLAAAGSLPAGSTEHVRLNILSILLRAVGLPSSYPQAKFCLWLHSQGTYDAIKKKIEAEGKSFDREVNNLYVSKTIATALLAQDKSLGHEEAGVRDAIRKQFPPQNTDITSEELLRIFKECLKLVGKDGRMPCTLLILDEVQQYIGDSNDRSVQVTEIAEALSKQLDSHVMIIGAGQSTLTNVPLLQKLMDRFTVRVALSDADVETVTRKVLLQKKPSAMSDIEQLLKNHAGEVSRQLQGTKLAERPEDQKFILEDYPLLPARRRFWEQCFRQIDAAGTTSQLRSQLRIIHDAVAKISDRPTSTLIAGDELFDALAPEMVNTGVLPREINERIIQLRQEGDVLSYRICGLVFLIGKLKKEAGADTGVRPIKEHIADLLVDDLKADNGKLRSEVEERLGVLVTKGVLMQIEDEYRLQTREGTDWDREFRNRQTKLNNDQAAIQFQRDSLLYAQGDEIVRKIRVAHGASKVVRELVVFREQTAPSSDGNIIPVWVRDGWSSSEKDMTEAARAVGFESPVLFVFIQRKSADDLKRWIVDSDAARQTLGTQGNPTTQEGQDARQSMQSRLSRSEAELNRLIAEILENAKVFQGGGNEVIRLSLADKITTAANDSLARLFPRFTEADSGAWEAVLRRVKEGADQPFQPVGHTEATERHPVCQQILGIIGSGKTGTDIRKALRYSPFGWPQDAIDAALIALHKSQHVSAVLNGSAVQMGQLDQNKIAKTEFRVEQVTLSMQDRLKLRQLFGKLQVNCRTGEELIRAGEFLTKLLALAQAAGGEPPLPAVPDTLFIREMTNVVGNEQLAAIKAKATEIDALIGKCLDLRNLASQRQASWTMAGQLRRHVQDLEGAKEFIAELEAIQSQRLLLQPANPVANVLAGFAKLLRENIVLLHENHEKAFAKSMSELSESAVWKKISDSDKKRILSSVGLIGLPKPDISNDESLAQYLDRLPLSTLRAEVDAVQGRARQAMELAAKLAEPKLQTLTLERVTLKDEADVNEWAERQKSKLLEAVKKGPVLLN